MKVSCLIFKNHQTLIHCIITEHVPRNKKQKRATKMRLNEKSDVENNATKNRTIEGTDVDVTEWLEGKVKNC